MRVLTLFLRFGVERYTDALFELERLFAGKLSGLDRETLIIDNALAEDYEERVDSSTLIIGGDNSQREFSGWDRGLRYVGERIWSFDYVNLVTSAFRELYNSYLQRFDTCHLEALLAKPAALGHIDCYNAPVAIGPHRFQHWLRSSFIFVPPAELKALGSLVSISSPVGIFSGRPEEPFSPEVRLSQNYKEYIIGWLTGGGTGQGVKWHSTFELNEETLPSFESKAVSIFNEALFSARLRALGCSLIDVTWFASLPAAGTVSLPLLSTPWKKQLAGRNCDRVLV